MNKSTVTQILFAHLQKGDFTPSSRMNLSSQ